MSPLNHKRIASSLICVAKNPQLNDRMFPILIIHDDDDETFWHLTFSVKKYPFLTLKTSEL